MTTFGVVDLGFGDAGKGTVVDWLSRRYADATVVRFHGGPQALHNVLTADGRHHGFAQFGSGTLVPGTRTFLSHHMLVDPLNMRTEAEALAAIGVTDAWERTMIDPECLVVTPYHRALNRIREAVRGANRHGTCGLGIGECVRDHLFHPDESLHVKDLTDLTETTRKLALLRERFAWEVNSGPLLYAIGPVRNPIIERENSVLIADIEARYTATADAYRQFADQANIGVPDLRSAPTVIFEGAQGVLLDENHGFHPHTTWSNCTYANAEHILREHRRTSAVQRLGVIRSYQTRHGAGPFPTESDDVAVPEHHNTSTGQQGSWRTGFLDLVALRYAILAVGGIHGLVMTHVDRIPKRGWDVCTGYLVGGEPVDLDDLPARMGAIVGKAVPQYERITRADYPEAVAEILGVPLYAVSEGPTAEDKRCL